MRPTPTTSPRATRPRYWLSKWSWSAYVCTLVIGIACPVWDGVYNDAPDTHPLQPDRLFLRILGLAFIAANFAIAGTAVFRARRVATRLRKGLCPACGYDLRASTDRCPECGAALPVRPAV
jgi:hypothetical protein